MMQADSLSSNRDLAVASDRHCQAKRQTRSWIAGEDELLGSEIAHEAARHLLASKQLHF